MDIRPTDVEDLVSRVSDGAKIALPPQYSNCSLVMARALIRRGVRDLHHELLLLLFSLANQVVLLVLSLRIEYHNPLLVLLVQHLHVSLLLLFDGARIRHT